VVGSFSSKPAAPVDPVSVTAGRSSVFFRKLPALRCFFGACAAATCTRLTFLHLDYHAVTLLPIGRICPRFWSLVRRLSMHASNSCEGFRFYTRSTDPARVTAEAQRRRRSSRSKSGHALPSIDRQQHLLFKCAHVLANCHLLASLGIRASIRRSRSLRRPPLFFTPGRTGTFSSTARQQRLNPGIPKLICIVFGGINWSIRSSITCSRCPRNSCRSRLPMIRALAKDDLPLAFITYRTSTLFGMSKLATIDLACARSTRLVHPSGTIASPSQGKVSALPQAVPTRDTHSNQSSSDI